MDEEKQEVVAVDLNVFEADCDASAVETFPLTLRTGHTFICRNICDSDEWRRLSDKLKSIKDLCTVGKDGKTKGAHPSWEEWLLKPSLMSETGIERCFYVSELVAEPKIPFARALRMYRKSGTVISELATAAVAISGDAARLREIKAMEAAKNASRETSGSSVSSSSPETCITGTQTS